MLLFKKIYLNFFEYTIENALIYSETSKRIAFTSPTSLPVLSLIFQLSVQNKGHMFSLQINF